MKALEHETAITVREQLKIRAYLTDMYLKITEIQGILESQKRQAAQFATVQTGHIDQTNDLLYEINLVEKQRKAAIKALNGIKSFK